MSNENSTNQESDAWRTNAVPFAHGFPNLHVIRLSIAELHRRFPGTALLGLQFPSSLSPALVDTSTDGEPVSTAQQIVSTMLHHFHLPSSSLVVRFKDSMVEPARISRTRNGDRLVEIQSSFMGSRDIVAILAHEIAHFFLDSVGLRRADTLENEILTDTAANYLGAGWSTLNAYRKSVSRATEWTGINSRRTTTTTSESKLGYLTPEEFGYVLARRCNITNEIILSWIERDEGKTAFAMGRKQFRRESAPPILANSNLVRRIRYKLAVWRSKKSAGHEPKQYDYGDFQIESAGDKNVIFRCPRCTQQLRLPVGKKHVLVKCGTCLQASDCSS